MSFEEHARNAKVDLSPLPITTLQLNITKLCNQACVHCHVDASPRRRETMSAQVMARCLGILRETESIETLDITGGAPELHPEFMSLVRGARTLGKHVIVRHNLTVTLDPHPLTREDMRYLPDFFVEQRVELVSSLPYHQEFFTDKQRGSGVFKKSIESLRLLNARGYGQEGSGLALNLVYNPVGPYLPASQESLERDYKHELRSRFGIEFNRLFALTNMPIHRFKAQLIRAGTYEDYMEKLSSAFNPAAAAAVMCRSLVSVSYDGKLYDCDFNQMLELPIGGEAAKTVFDFDPAALQRRSIRLGSHCYGCTAGAGSSCGGNTT
jgi:radical SAM/Cys-rich protein